MNKRTDVNITWRRTFQEELARANFTWEEAEHTYINSSNLQVTEKSFFFKQTCKIIHAPPRPAAFKAKATSKPSPRNLALEVSWRTRTVLEDPFPAYRSMSTLQTLNTRSSYSGKIPQKALNFVGVQICNLVRSLIADSFYSPNCVAPKYPVYML